MASKVLVPAAPFAKLKVARSPSESPHAGLVLAAEPAARAAHLEHSLRFLQEQHRLMLSGLHQEIEGLRERNRDLQFQLIFNKESASKNNSPSSENKENIAVETNEVETLKAELSKMKHEAAAARSEARTAEARALQLQRLVDLQAEKLREQDSQKPTCTGEHCESLDATRGELRARLADAERLVRRLRADAERQRREVRPDSGGSVDSGSGSGSGGSGSGVTNLLYDRAHAQHAHLQCMKNSLHASLRATAGMEYGYQNYHFPAQPGPDYWREPQQLRDSVPPSQPGRTLRACRRVMPLPELHGHHAPRATIYANHHTQPLQPHVTGYEKPKRQIDPQTHSKSTSEDAPELPNTIHPNEYDLNTVDLHITKSMMTYPELKVVIAKMIPRYNAPAAPRPRARRHRRTTAATDHT